MKSMIGLAKVDITPDFVTGLAGYNSKIPRESEGVHDRIFARVLSVEMNDCTIVILSVPTVEVEIDSTEFIRSEAAKALKIPKHNVLVHATHSHSCPKAEGKYKKILEHKCVECIKESFANRFGAKIGFGKTTVNECGKNRRRLLYGGLPVDPEITVMKIEDECGNLKAVVYNYACHCTVLGVDNKLISEDWPFFTRNLIQKQKGSEVDVIFMQGASGDINPGYSAGLSAVGANIPVRTWDEARRIGEKVGNAVIETVDKITTEDIVKLKSLTHEFKLPVRTDYPLTLEQADEKHKQAELNLSLLEKAENASVVKLDEAKMQVFFASLVKDGADNFYSGKWGKELQVEVQAICINDNVITTFPCEVFCEDAMNLKNNSPARHTMVAELSNIIEASGYIPTASAYDDGDYEVFSSCYREDAASILINESLKNINSLFI